MYVCMWHQPSLNHSKKFPEIWHEGRGPLTKKSDRARFFGKIQNWGFLALFLIFPLLQGDLFCRVKKLDGPCYTSRLYLGGNGWVNVFSLTEVRLGVGGLHPWRHAVSQHLEEYLWSKVHLILRWYLKGSSRMNIFKTLDVWWRHISEMTSHTYNITCPLIFSYYIIAR